MHAQSIAVDDDGGAVLIATDPGAADFDTAGAHLLDVDLDDGETRELGAWSSLQAVAPATGGWLVTGRPRAMPAGIYRVDADGAATAVLTGPDVLGADLRDGRLVFAAPSRSSAGSGRSLLAIALADLGAAGARVQPFAAAHLNGIGGRLLAAGVAPPRTEREIREALRMADALAHERVGADLPASAADLDALIGEAVTDVHDLAPEGRILLSLLLARGCMDQGAQWIEPKAAAWSRWLAPGPRADDSWFAVARSPGTLLSAALDDSEAGWHPIDDLVASAEGRSLLLGLEEESSRSALAAAAPQEWHDAVERADATALLGCLRARSANSFARARLYERLAAQGELAAVEAIAKEMSASDAARAVDAMAWLSAWTERATDPADVDALVAAATDAMHRYPAEASLYYCLGRAYERLSPGAPERAIACYRRVVDMQAWGDASQAARAAIERLGG